MPAVMEATMKTTKALMIATLAVSAIGMTPGISRASECGMGDVDWYSGERARVSRADSLLDDGQPREAAAVIESTWPRMREARPVAESLTHIADAVRIMALACVRSDGDVGEGNGWTSKTEADRASNVRWGISRIRMLSAAHPGNPSLKVDLGEALSRSPATESEAKNLLEAALADHDITSAQAYSALAELRRDEGDVEGAIDVVTECTMTFAVPQCAERTTNRDDAPAPSASR
jgi:hypothetical protein